MSELPGKRFTSARAVAHRVLAVFPVRVWRRFLRNDGFLLAAGISYQSLFAVSAAIYVVFAAVGLWLDGGTTAVNALIDLVNSYIPGLISESGLVTPEQVASIVAESADVLGFTGALALGVLVWTAIGFITFARRSVRNIFALHAEQHAYVFLKARDLLAAGVFGAALVVGWLLGQIATWAISFLLAPLGIVDPGIWLDVLIRALAIVTAFAINMLALAGLFRFLEGLDVGPRQLLPGSMLGAAAIVVLQLGAGLAVGYAPSNPLLATFATLIGLLLWFRLAGVAILCAAAWIAVAAQDRNLRLSTPASTLKAG